MTNDSAAPGLLQSGPPLDRTTLAHLRTGLALDRTALAWVRTTLTMGSFGFGMVGFFRALRQSATSPDTVRLHEGAIYFGTALVLLAAMSTVLAAISQWRTLRQLRRGQTPNMSQWPLTMTISFLTALLFLAALWVVFPRDIT
jgi:putative membrane protein